MTAHAATVYVSYEITSRIEKFSSTGTDLGAFATTGSNSPAGIAFDSVGNPTSALPRVRRQSPPRASSL